MRKSFSVFVLLSLCFLSVFSQSPPQSPPQNEQFQALQAHFDRVISERFNRLFAGLESVAEMGTAERANPQGARENVMA